MDSERAGLSCVLALALLIVVVSPAAGEAASCPHGWCGVVGVALVGFNHTVRQTKTQGLCHGACTAEPWCRSANYEMGTGRCQLVLNASHHTAPDRLVQKRGWFYSYIDAEPTGISLGRFADQKQEPACVENNDADITTFIRTRDRYPSANISLAREGCTKYHPALQLCTLPQLKAAYDAGFADGVWSLYDTEGWDAKLSTCSIWYPDECYVLVEGSATDSYIPYTPRPFEVSHAYCCSSNCFQHPLQWQLVFKGPGDQRMSTRSLYELWTDPLLDSREEPQGAFRDNTIYDAWNNREIPIKFVKLSLFTSGDTKPAKQLIFTGELSTVTDWFNKDRILSCPWWDTSHSWTFTGVMSMNGSEQWPKRQFLISSDSINCTSDMGWMFVAGSTPACPWIAPHAILYSTTPAPVLWSEITESGGRVGVADHMTIHVIIG
ncbi:uncharacterized protein LOC119731808 [Patiria miniata]|uniref:Apple domain-containing protein n=1 Tax=Patiria miniata TaxID=46514 RepID=A0A914ACE1_PATMI|nr:uncharacterized protein LOC119731808 [Patiria miniata]